MLAMYCKDAEESGVGLLTATAIRAMDFLTSASLCDDSGSDHEENGVESVSNDNNDNDSISAQLATQNSNDNGSMIMIMSSKYLC